MIHEEARKALERMLTYKIASKSKFGMKNIEDYQTVKSYLIVTNATILECISLLSVSGENTKAIVAEKLRGIVE